MLTYFQSFIQKNKFFVNESNPFGRFALRLTSEHGGYILNSVV